MESNEKNNKEDVNKSFFERILPKLKTILYVYLALTLLVFFVCLAKFLPNRPYPKAKILMSAALTINRMYVMPLNKLLGYRNIASLPFYFLQDALYNQGLKYIPKDDGEREMWWFAIRYVEYEEIIEPAIVKKCRNYSNKPYPKEDAMLYDDWTMEVYNHIKPFATLKIKDSTFRKQRYNLLVNVVYKFQSGKALFTCTYIKHITGSIKMCMESPEEFNLYKDALKTFLQAKKYIKEFEPEGWNHFYNETQNYYYDSKVEHLMSTSILQHEAYTDVLSCSSPYFKIYDESRERLKMGLYDNRISLNERKGMNYATNYGGGHTDLIVAKCGNNKYLQHLIQDSYPPERLKKIKTEEHIRRLKNGY